MRQALAPAAALLLMAGCGQSEVESRAPGLSVEETLAQPAEPAPKPFEPPVQGGSDDWRTVASAADQARLGRIVEAWNLGLTQAREDFDPEVTAAGVALAPGAGLTGGVQPPPGDYRCRLYKLGSPAEGGLGFVAYPDFRCRVELTAGGDLILTRVDGSQRTRGLIYPQSEDRSVFIGAQAWGDETSYPAYGQMADRNQIGAVERIGENAWRVVYPFPMQESLIDVLVLER